MAIVTIARITLREASRRKLLLAVAILTVVVAIVSGWGFHRLLQLPCGSGEYTHPCPPAEIRLLAATMLILLMFMFSFVLALGAAFIGAPSISADLESGVLLSMLPRPIRRSDVILGKWLGLATLLAVFIGTACGMEFIIANIALSYVPPHPVLSTICILAESIVVLTLALAASTRLSGMTGGITVIVLFGLTWMGGITGGVGAAFNSKPIQSVGTVSSLVMPTDGLWRAAIYNLEPISVIVAQDTLGRRASANPFFVLAPPTTAYIAWCIAWVVAVLGLALWSFHRREL